MPAEQHKEQVRAHLKVGIVTSSDTRTADDDLSGAAIRELFEGAGHAVTYYEIVPDAPAKIAHAIITHLPALDAIVVNGGTGLARRDVTADVGRSLLGLGNGWNAPATEIEPLYRRTCHELAHAHGLGHSARLTTNETLK